jgi:hypothetical protein
MRRAESIRVRVRQDRRRRSGGQSPRDRGEISFIDAVPHVPNRAPRHVAAASGTHDDGSAKLTQAAYWQAIQGYLRPGNVLFVDGCRTSFCLHLAVKIEFDHAIA